MVVPLSRILISQEWVEPMAAVLVAVTTRRMIAVPPGASWLVVYVPAVTWLVMLVEPVSPLRNTAFRPPLASATLKESGNFESFWILMSKILVWPRVSVVLLVWCKADVL